jgi:hypothetical protein
VDFTGASYELTAELFLISYLVMMSLALLNLLITLLMKRYDEVSETMEKQYAFVRASTVYEHQGSVLDNELPPPFNLLQLVHPDRGKLAWVVWLTVWTPVCGAVFVFSWAVATCIFVPPVLLHILHQASIGGGHPVKGVEFDEGSRQEQLQQQRRLSSSAHSVKLGLAPTNSSPGRVSANSPDPEVKQSSAQDSSQPSRGGQNFAPDEKRVAHPFQRLFKRGVERLSMFFVAPFVFVVSWVGFFLSLLVFGVFHWAVILICSAFNAVQVYIPAIKALWRQLGAHLIDVVANEVSEEEEEENRIKAALFQANGRICEEYTMRRDQ